MIPRFNRRDLLRTSTAGAGALAGTTLLARAGVLTGVLGLSSAAASGVAGAIEGAALPLPFISPLRQPPVITDADISLVAREADVQLLPGQPTKMWTFGGTWPGPTIRRPSGQQTTVRVTNDLPAEVGDITVHHHGGHQAAEHDGGPVQDPVLPGATRTYVYELMEDGEGERAATQWYHDHSHFRTGRNNWFGLQGMFIIDDDVEAALGLPDGDQDLVLMCTNRDVDEQNQLLDRFTAPDREEATALDAAPVGGTGRYPLSGDETASLGPMFLVNGVLQPFADVQARRYRLRLMNAANWQVYNFSLSGPNGTVPMVQIAAEAGLLPVAVERDDILLGPAERAEVIVDFTGMEGQRLVLASGPGSASAQGAVPFYNGPTPAEFVEFRVGPVDPDHPDTSSVIDHGQALRELPHWAAGLAAQPDRVWVFGVGVDEAGRAAWTINGRAFDHDRVDARPELGASETWLLANTTQQTHFIHIHDVDWVVLQRNGDPAPVHEQGLKETFRIDPGEVVLVGSTFTDHLGPYMMHCHMLEHEDHGMMNTWEVVEPGQGDRPAGLGSVVEALAADMATAESLSVAQAVIGAARNGRPAPMSLLNRLNVGRGVVTDIPSQAALYCDLNDLR